MAAPLIEFRAVTDLAPSPTNARTHSPAQVDQIAASIREFGFVGAILADADGIVAGHGRAMAAAQIYALDMPIMLPSGEEIPDGMVPVLDCTGWSLAQRKAYMIADNSLALQAGWNEDILAAEIAALSEVDFDIDLLGFDAAELHKLLGSGDGATDPDEAPPVPEVPVSRIGDIWIMGDHRIICGSSTDPEDVAAVSNSVKPSLMFTSPPYAQQRDYGRDGGIGDWDSLMNGVFDASCCGDDSQLLINLGLIYRDGECIEYWAGWISRMRIKGWRLFGWYVWDQGGGLPGDWNGRLAPSHEFIFHLNKKPLRPEKWIAKKPESVRVKSGTGVRRKDGSMSGISSPSAGLQTNKIADSVFRVQRQQTERLGHPAGFPVSFAEQVLMSYSHYGDSVYEPFSGSGTTIIAGQITGRRVLAVELNPQYIDVAVTRWQNFAEAEAILESTGQTFEQVRAERLGE